MQINFNLARQAIKLLEFQEFMIKEIKLTQENIEKLKECGSCLAKLTFAPKTVEIINTYLDVLEGEGKIEIPVQYLPLKQKEIVTDKDSAKKFIDSIEDFKQIIIGIK